jgi:hypothetical protein
LPIERYHLYLDEVWKPVVGFEGLYEVSNRGRIRSLDRWVDNKGVRQKRKSRLLRFGRHPSTANGGGIHLSAGLSKNGVRVTRGVQCWVLDAFVGLCSKGKEACHWDGDGENNFVENLRWGTPKENGQDKSRHGRSLRGEANANSKLTFVKVKRIRDLRKQGMSIVWLSKVFKVSKNTVRNVISGFSWSHAPVYV